MISSQMAAPIGRWKIGIGVGTALVIGGISAGYIDVATHFRFDFISRYFGFFILALLIGLVLSFVAVIGWAKQFGSGTRLRTAGVVFVAPWMVALVGYPIDGFNIHGPSALLLVLVFPAALLLSLVLLIMAGY